MPILQTISIKKPVGEKAFGGNSLDDVRAVQKQLNGHMGPSRTKLAEDGKSGPKTIGAIKDFQKNVCGFRNCDGRVDPQGKTERSLNDPASTGKWARMSPQRDNMTPGVAVTDNGSAKPGTSPRTDPTDRIFIDHAEKAAARLPAQERDYFNEFRRELIDNQFPWVKGFFAAFQSAEIVDNIVRSYVALRKCGNSPKEAVKFLHDMFKFQKKGTAAKTFEALGKNSKFSAFAKELGGKAGAAAILVSLVEVADKSAQGDYHYGAVEAWKIYVGKRVPYFAMIDGIWTIVDAIVPKSAKASKVYKVLRAVDPAGIQATGVDAVGALALCTIHSIEKGEMDQATLERVVSRMKGGPASVFADMGEELVDAIDELRTHPLDHHVLKTYVIFCWNLSRPGGTYKLLWEWLKS